MHCFLCCTSWAPDKRCFFARLPAPPVGNIAILKIGVDLTKVGNKLGEEGGFPFRLKWGHPTEIFIPQPGFLYLMHPGKGAQKHNTPKVLKHKNYYISFLIVMHSKHKIIFV